MATDLKAGTRLEEDISSGFIEIQDVIDFVTFNGSMTDLSYAHSLITEMYDKLYTEKEHNTVWDTYEFNKTTIAIVKHYYVQSIENNLLAEDSFIEFLDKLLATDSNVFYLAIF